MLCKLCLKEKKLLKQSHIIPNFLYRPLHGDDGEFYSVSLLGNKAKSKKIYTGYFERNILCAECDNVIINKYENYFSTILDKLRNRKILVEEKNNMNNVRHIEIHDVEYTNTKLFFLSILWRASISNLKEFSGIKLSDQQEEELRKMLLNKNPGLENYYPIFPMMISGKSIFVTKTFRKSVIEGNLCFNLIINGSPNIFFVENNYPIWALGHGPKMNNKFSIILLNDEQGNFLQKDWIDETVSILKAEKINKKE